MGEPCPSKPAPRASTSIVRLAAIAEAQWGPFDRRQLLEAGLTGSGIDRWVKQGRLVRLYPEVYALAPVVMPIEGHLKAALLYADPGAALSHITAAWWWKVWGSEPRLIHVSTPGKRDSSRKLRVHDRRTFATTTHNDFPVTTVAQTLLDIAALVRFRELRHALAEAEFRGLLQLDEVEAILGRGRPGSAALRRAAETHRPELARARSELERAFVFLCETYAIPMPEINAKVCGLTVDALWREQRLIVEVDGVPGHASAARMRNDRRRDLKLRGAGFVVLRYSWGQITREHVLAAEDVLAALEAGASAGASSS